MKSQELSRNYATAVFSLALEKWVSSLSAVRDKLVSDGALMKKLTDSKQAFKTRQKELDKVIPQGVGREVRNFLYKLLQDNNLGMLSEILGELDRMSRGGAQVEVAYVTTAISLSEQEKKQFREKLSSQQGKELEIVFKTDPSIIGGAVVQVGDKLIDGSVATRLEAISSKLDVKSKN